MYNESNGGSRSPYQYHPKSPAAQSAPYIPLSTSYPLYPAASSSTQCSFDLLKGKVEHLENERVNLSLQLQEQSEKDRTRKIRIEQLESDLKISYAAQVSLKQVGEESQAKIKLLVDSNADLVLEIVKLNERIELSAKEASGAQNFWSKMTAAHRELRRLEDEALKTRRERADLEAEKEELISEIIKLEELNERRSEEMTLLRLEIEGQRRTFKDSKTALETANASTTVEAVSLRGALQEALESKELVEENFRIERYNFEENINELMKQLAARPEPAVRGISNGEEEEQLDSVFVDDLRKKLLESELKRKQLHNTLQELRGNIRVFVRCRPFLPGDGEEYPNSENLDPNVGGCVRFHKDGSSVSLSSSSSSRSTPQVFNFDQVFKCDSTQDEVFNEVSDLVQSALDGYKVCIFSYGQTGSGKTHTMTGAKGGDMRGIIPRSVEQIIQQVMLMRESGWEIVVTASMVEIYNEDLRDLLAAPSTGLSASEKEKEKSKLKISNLQGFVTIAGLTFVELNTEDLKGGLRQLEGLLDKAGRARMTASTAMNEHSSRSHALFMLDIGATHSDGVTFLRGGLRLCDLAGSERLDRTGTASDATRLKETVNINKSLSCLADVFVSLGNKAPHIPYRNSKLTMVLQDCLSGDGKALMFVNVSPTNNSSQETLCSLRFASQVNQVELGKANKCVYTIPVQLQPKMQPQPVASFAQTAASSGAVSKGGPVRLTGSKRPLGCASSSGASLAPASGGPRESPGRANPTCGLNPMHNEASHKRNRQNQNTPISSNLAISFSNISHLGATRSSSWR